MAKSIYIGHNKTGYQDTQITITSSNISQYFSYDSGNYYYFYYSSSTSKWVSNNSGDDSTTATITLTATTTIENATISYGWSSESGCDIFAIYKNDNRMVEESGEGESSWTGTINIGDTFQFLYDKDGSVAVGDDQCYFSISFTTQTQYTQYNIAHKVKQCYVGIDDIARRIKRAYIGIGGIARPCWDDTVVTYYGTCTALSTTMSDFDATTVGNYAVFGGMNSDKSAGQMHNLNAYDRLLTQTIVYNAFTTETSTTRSGLAATTVGNYALFGGGYGTATVDACSSSLTHSLAPYLNTGSGIYRSELAATTVGNYAIFAGGEIRSDTYTYSMDVYDTSLTKSEIDLTIPSCSYIAATTVAGYALFAGGFAGTNNYKNYVYAYNTSLTRNVLETLSTNGYHFQAATVGNYAIFGGAAQPLNKTLEIYDASLTHTTITNGLRSARHSSATASLGNYALFAGGRTSTSAYAVASVNYVDAFDTSLTRTQPTNLSVARHSLAATTIGNYALFAGGLQDKSGGSSFTQTTQQSIVDVYTLT